MQPEQIHDGGVVRAVAGDANDLFWVMVAEEEETLFTPPVSGSRVESIPIEEGPWRWRISQSQTMPLPALRVEASVEAIALDVIAQSRAETFDVVGSDLVDAGDGRETAGRRCDDG